MTFWTDLRLLARSDRRVTSGTIILLILVILRFIKRWLLPRIIQRLIADAWLRFDGVSMTGIRSNGQFRMYVTGQLGNGGPLPAVIHGQTPTELRFTDKQGKSYTVARCSMPDIALEPSGPSQVTSLKLSMDAQVLDEEGFGLFGAEMLNAASFSMQMHIDQMQVSAFAGLLQIEGIQLDKQISMKGLNGLKEIEVVSMVIEEGTPTYLFIRAKTRLRNPSDIAIQMGTVEFTLYHDNEPVGRLTLPHAHLKPGMNDIEAIGFYSPSSRPSHQLAGRRLLSQHLCGLSSEIQIRGHRDSCKHCETGGGHFLAPAISTLVVNTEMPGQPLHLIKEARLLLFQTNPVTMNAPSIMVLVNPFDVPVTVCHMKGIVRLAATTNSNSRPGSAATDGVDGSPAVVKPSELGSINVELEEPWVMDPKVEFTSPPVSLSITMGMATLNAVIQVATKGLRVDVDAELTCYVGDYFVVVQYHQFGVPVLLS